MEVFLEGSGDIESLYVVLKVCKGDWSNGMTGVSKTLSGSSILSSPVLELAENVGKWRFY